MLLCMCCKGTGGCADAFPVKKNKQTNNFTLDVTDVMFSLMLTDKSWWISSEDFRFQTKKAMRQNKFFSALARFYTRLERPQHPTPFLSFMFDLATFSSLTWLMNINNNYICHLQFTWTPFLHICPFLCVGRDPYYPMYYSQSFDKFKDIIIAEFNVDHS